MVKFAYVMDREDASSKRVILVIVFSLPEKQGALGIKEVLSQLEVGCRNLLFFVTVIPLFINASIGLNECLIALVFVA